MAKSHPAHAQFDDQDAPRQSQSARGNPANIALLVGIATLSILLYGQHGVRIPGALVPGIGTLGLGNLGTASDDPMEPVAVDSNEPKYRAIGDYLARRYRVSSDMATHPLVR